MTNEEQLNHLIAEVRVSANIPDGTELSPFIKDKVEYRCVMCVAAALATIDPDLADQFKEQYCIEMEL